MLVIYQYAVPSFSLCSLCGVGCSRAGNDDDAANSTMKKKEEEEEDGFAAHVSFLLYDHRSMCLVIASAVDFALKRRRRVLSVSVSRIAVVQPIPKVRVEVVSEFQ